MRLKLVLIKLPSTINRNSFFLTSSQLDRMAINSEYAKKMEEKRKQELLGQEKSKREKELKRKAWEEELRRELEYQKNY